jgi:hypothetical protein
MSIKRLNYFTGQFLKEKDFKDEQSYHINALSMHNKNLHSWGIASGLDVLFDKTKKHVILEEGMAIDRNGRQILLEKPMKIDFLKSSTSTVHLTISLKITESDPAEANEFGGNTRICEEALIELDGSMPDDESMKIFLAKIIFDPENKTAPSIDKSNRKIIGLSDEIRAKNITFIQKKEQKEWPMIKGLDGKDADLEIRSRKTTLTGDLNVAGTLSAGKISGVLDKDTVGISQIKNESISVSKIKSNKNIVSVEGTIDGMGEKAVAVEDSNTHLFLVTSVIPTTPGQIEWKWQTEYRNNKLSYVLMLKNLSDKSIKYDVRYFDISEK